ncbi:MAG: hypothetical protein JNM86_10285 [Phycisphaerae bacterium]|nr:hypothetical protein [Phycisphaerae bacterium]
MPIQRPAVLLLASTTLLASTPSHPTLADPGVWAGSTFTLDSFCLAEAKSPIGTEFISGIGEGFDVGISNFAFATLSDFSTAAASSNAFSRFGPNAGMPRGDRIIIEGASSSRLAPEAGWSGGRAFGRSSVRVDFSLPFGGRFRVLDGWFRQDSGASSSSVTLASEVAPVFAFGQPTDLPAGVFGVLEPGDYSLLFGSISETTLGTSLELSTEASYAFDLQLLANVSCPGDFNRDSQIDDADFPAFAIAYNLLDCADPGMPTDCPADLDFSGFVDDGDFVVFARAYDSLLCP